MKQAKNEVVDMCNTLRKKLLTDKQLLYLYNMVIIPKLEYRTQLTFLSRRECDNIIKPFRKLFKQKLHLATSIPNAILENKLIYNLETFTSYNYNPRFLIFYYRSMKSAYLETLPTFVLNNSRLV